MENKRAKQKRKQALEEVLALYEELPQIHCRGLCHETCGSIPIVNAELPLINKAIKGPVGRTIEMRHVPSNKQGHADSKIPDGVLLCGRGEDLKTCLSI